MDDSMEWDMMVAAGSPTPECKNHYWKIRSHNPEIKLQHTKVKFRPYSTDTYVPLLGSMGVRLTSSNGMTHKTRVYVTKGQRESLLGKEDATALGILRIEPGGYGPNGAPVQPVRCITPETKDEQIKSGIVSGGQTQEEIDATMAQIVKEHEAVFQGMGRA